MNFLSIETSTNICSVSLFLNSILENKLENKTQEHSKILPVYAQKLLNKISIDYIALSIGPGSFSSLKIGTAFSKGLANALNIPIIPISTFDGMKCNISDKENFYIFIYSHRDYIFTSLYNQSNKISDSKCINIYKLDDYKLYGYGIPKDLKVEYNEVIPDSEKIGILSLEQFKLFQDNDINDINPNYLMVEK